MGDVNFSKFLPLIPSEYHTYLSTWSPTSFPATKTLSYIAPTHASDLSASITSIQYAVATETERNSLYSLYRLYRGAQASLTIINNENMIATGTATQDFPEMTAAIYNATLNLISLDKEANLYSSDLSKTANLTMAILFAIIFLWQAGLAMWSRHFYFGFCFVLGTGLEFAGYLARYLTVGDYSNYDKFVCQIICLTLAPAFLMAGIYLLLAQLIVLHGRHYSILKPMWFSYIFIVCDVGSLVVQAIGGAIAGIALNEFRSTVFGTHIMVGGIAFQVVSMTLFLYFLFDFINRSLFRTGNTNVRFTVGNYLKCLLNTKGGRNIKQTLNPFYNPKHDEIRQRAGFGLIPLMILLSVVLVYIRCIYRVVELAQGWKGYLITHEVYVMTLDALMILLTCIIYSIYHPSFMFGKDCILTYAYIKKAEDVDFNDTGSENSFVDEKKAYESNHRNFKHLPQNNPFDDQYRYSYTSTANSNTQNHYHSRMNSFTTNNQDDAFKAMKYSPNNEITDEVYSSYQHSQVASPSFRIPEVHSHDLSDKESFIFS
ncbi:putative transporter or flippase transmembrane protein [Scheffersomyces amazonensis]|uniref:putative transporter or flippase transmembrane protein n=1 Tax=Scheffersomyces amazonensis TaxID=1078765 RepID=UPI00315C9D93